MIKNKILRAKQVKEVVGYSIPSIYRLAKQGLFPKPIKLGERGSAWLVSEVDAWLQSRVDLRDRGNS